MVLADKGYHTGAELLECQQDNMITHVAYKEQPSVKHIANEFLAESFSYDKASDSYVCPAGATLTSLGTWHNKKGEANETGYRFKTYRTDACRTCPLKERCTKLPKRIIQRSEYQDAVDINDNNIKQNPAVLQTAAGHLRTSLRQYKKTLGLHAYLAQGPAKSKRGNEPYHVLLQLYADQEHTGL